MGSENNLTPVPHGMLIFKEQPDFISCIFVLQSQGRLGSKISVAHRKQPAWLWNSFGELTRNVRDTGFFSEIKAVFDRRPHPLCHTPLLPGPPRAEINSCFVSLK